MKTQLVNIPADHSVQAPRRLIQSKKRWRWVNWQLGIINIICAVAGVGAVILGTGMIVGK